MKIYLKLSTDNTIIDCVTYQYKNYIEIEVDDFPPDILSGEYKLVDDKIEKKGDFVKYFTCEIRNVKIGGVDVYNAIIVTGVQTGETQPDFTYLIPEAYIGANIVGLRYVPDTQTFEVVDAEPDPEAPKPLATQEDVAKVEQSNLDIMEGILDMYLFLSSGGM